MFSFVFVLFLLTSALISKQSQCLPSLPSAASLIYRMASHPSHAEHPKGYVAYKSAHPITLSGKMDDPAWAHAPWSDLFVDILGEDNDKPDHPHPWHDTRVKMMWDEECLYIGAWMEEPTPWANLTLHVGHSLLTQPATLTSTECISDPLLLVLFTSGLCDIPR